MAKLLLPLNHYDESGRIKPPRFFWWGSLFLAKSYFIFVLSLSNFRDSDQLLEIFYPDQNELYFGFAIGLWACLAMAIVAYREKWWDTPWHQLRLWVKPLLFIAVGLDVLHQLQLAANADWQYLWHVATFLLIDFIILYWLIKSRHLRYMVSDWTRLETR